MSIEIVSLTKHFGGVPAVDNLSLTIPQGKMLVLLGPSGCGKTTAMRCVAGLQQPDSGTITIGGEVVFDDNRRINVQVNKRNVGMVFQSYAIWPHMTVYENVAFPLEMKRIPKSEREESVFAILKTVGLEGLAHRGASYLSGGQMQRVALARSLVMRPSVLLFDEPLSNLDTRLRDRLRVELRELQLQFGITSIYVTHDQHEALAVADEIAVMQKGRALQIGDPLSIYQQPASSTIAEFLGYSNIFRAGSAGADGAGTIVALMDGGARLRTSSTVPATSEFYACIRPEDVAIVPAGGCANTNSTRCGNSLNGEVLLASFMGAYMQYQVRVENVGTLEVVSTVIRKDIAIGCSVDMSVDPAAIRLLPKS